MYLLRGIPHETAHALFYVLHPAHVLVSALATASMYRLHRCGTDRLRCSIWVLLLVGYVGSVGIATVSDSIIPYWGELLLGLPRSEPHIGFIEMWWLVNPLALLGIAIAYFRPGTKIPHAAHVLLSTWASMFHVVMALGGRTGWLTAAAVFVFLFLAVWLPCTVSDIVFPLLWVRNPARGGDRD